MNCFWHPNTSTLVSCGRCEKKICPQCMVSTSAGMRCPDCAYVSGYVPTKVAETGSMGMAAFAGLLTGLAGGFILSVLAAIFPLLSVVSSPVYGRLVADSIVSFNGEAKNKTVQAVGVGSILIGSLIAFGNPVRSLQTTHGAMPEFTQAMVGVSIGVAVAVCYQRLSQRTTS